jgi:hypothetical protein
MGASLIGVSVGGLRAGAFFRYFGIFLSSMAGVPGGGAAAYGGGPMAAGAAGCSDCSSCFDLPELDSAVYVGTVAGLIPIGWNSYEFDYDSDRRSKDRQVSRQGS